MQIQTRVVNALNRNQNRRRNINVLNQDKLAAAPSLRSLQALRQTTTSATHRSKDDVGGDTTPLMRHYVLMPMRQPSESALPPLTAQCVGLSSKVLHAGSQSHSADLRMPVSAVHHTS